MNVVHKNELFQILDNQIGNIKQFYHMIMGCEVICLSFCYGIFHHFCFRLKMNRKTNFKYTSTFINHLTYFINSMIAAPPWKNH